MFNKKNQEEDNLTNYMGAKAYKLTPELALYTTVVTSLIQDSYYEKATEHLNRIRLLIPHLAPEFVAKLAVYAREQMYLRAMPIVLAVELSRLEKGRAWVAPTLARIVQRADEITEVLAYYTQSNVRTNKKKLSGLSKQVQKGLAQAFNKFDEYQFAKYDRAKEIKLRDALFLIHPKPKDEAQQAIFDKIANRTLATPYTWETQLSDLGKQTFANEAEKQQAKALLWEELMASQKVGYMATLRNLKNIILQGSKKALQFALEQLTNATQVKKAKQLPFRYLSAYIEVEKILQNPDTFPETKQKVAPTLKALETATTLAVDNIPIFEGKTLILSDNSGSMRGDAGGNSLLSAMSRRKTSDIANLFAVLCWKRNPNSMIGLFGDRIILPQISPDTPLFEAFQMIDNEAQKCGLATETGIFQIFKELLKNKTVVDRIIIFSDCQIGTGCRWFSNSGKKADDFNALYKQYKETINPHVFTYSIDLRGYGNTIFQEGILTMGGWSEKIFDLISALEKGSSIEQEIMNIEI